MQTSVIVSQVRTLYESLASSSAAFISELNEVTERLMSSDLWHGCTDEVLFGLSDDGYLVLPRPFVSVLGYTRNGCARPVFDQFHEYQQLGIGWQDVDRMGCFGLLDTGMVPSQKEITGTATLRVKPSVANDAGKTIRFYGKDQNGFPVFTPASGVDGIPLITAVPSSDTTQQFTVLTGVQASGMVGRWTLWQVVNGQETQIGSYEPGEDVPSYRRYKIGLRTDETVVRCFCRRQWVPVVAETDFVFPGCMAAIKMGLKALQLEDANKYGSDRDPNADDQWQRAYSELDNELAVIRGGALPTLKMIGGPYPMWNYTVN